VVRKVKIGLRTAQQAQVLSGLEAGEQVLVGPVPTPASSPQAGGAGGGPMITDCP